MHVIEPGCCTYYLGDVLFRDDPVLTDQERREAEMARGGSGLTTPVRDPDGTWRVIRDIQLGAGVPGYDRARQRRP
jgi:protocatechuate 3,4-dioxygenase beta subunit